MYFKPDEPERAGRNEVAEGVVVLKKLSGTRYIIIFTIEPMKSPRANMKSQDKKSDSTPVKSPRWKEIRYHSVQDSSEAKRLTSDELARPVSNSER